MKTICRLCKANRLLLHVLVQSVGEAPGRQPAGRPVQRPETPLPAPSAVRLQSLGRTQEELVSLPHDRLSEI